MEKVYVVVTPQCHGDYDEIQEDSITQDIKLASLDGIESEWRAKHDNEFGNTYTASSYTSWMTFGTSFIGSIVENLQVQISDVHIRYEDHVSLDNSVCLWSGGLSQNVYIIFENVFHVYLMRKFQKYANIDILWWLF